jgi:hypothetical protein
MSGPWPLFALRLRSARLELRSPTDPDLFALLEVARAGVHDPATMPFVIAWTDLRGDAFTYDDRLAEAALAIGLPVMRPV